MAHWYCKVPGDRVHDIMRKVQRFTLIGLPLMGLCNFVCELSAANASLTYLWVMLSDYETAATELFTASC